MGVNIGILRYVAAVWISETQATLTSVIERVWHGDEVTITRFGEPVAVVTMPKNVSSNPLDLVANLSDRLASARHQPIKRVTERPGWADQIIAQIRVDRNS